MSPLPVKRISLLFVILTVALTLACNQGAPESPVTTGSKSVVWATDENSVLIRWFGRDAAGLEDNDETILPGSAGAPTIKLERKTGENGGYSEVASGISRQSPDANEFAQISQSAWWDDLSEFLSSNLSVPKASIALLDAFAYFDQNVLAAELWASRHHELALILGMGFIDLDVNSNDEVGYRVSLEYPNGTETVLGETSPITVGVNEPISGSIIASSEAVDVLQVSPVSDDLSTDQDWLSDQGQRRWINERIFVGWQFSEGNIDVNGPETPSTSAFFNVYRYPASNTFSSTGTTIKINQNPILPGGSSDDWLFEGFEGNSSNLIGFDQGSGAFEDEVGQPSPALGLLTYDDSPDRSLPQDQIYCYFIRPVDYLGNEGVPQPQAENNGETNCTRFKDQIPPDPPSGLVATISGQTVRLAWNSVSDAVQYSIYSAETLPGNPMPSSSGSWNELASVVPQNGQSRVVYEFNLPAVPESDEDENDLWFRVRAFDQSGNRSSLSQPVFAFVRDAKAPDSPLIVSYGEERKSPDGQTIFIDTDCFQIEVDSDTDFVQIYRRIEGGEYELIATLAIDDFDALQNWCDESINGASGSFDVAYLVQAHDSDGNYSWSDPVTVKVGIVGELDPPVITSIAPKQIQAGQINNQITWIADQYPSFDMIDIYRFSPVLEADAIQSSLDQVTPSKSLIVADMGSLIQDLGNGYWRATYTDEGLPEGASDYSYIVASRDSSLDVSAFSNPAKAPSSYFDGIPYSTRNIEDAIWCQNLTFFAQYGVELNWGLPAAGDKSCLSIESESKNGIRDVRAHMVFRSRQKESGYVQLTPVLGQDEFFYDSAGFADSGYRYVDEDASHGTYWYVVVILDAETGEPSHVTEPSKIVLQELSTLDESVHANVTCERTQKVRVGDLVVPNELYFGDYENPIYVCEWKNLGQTSTQTFKGSGSGFTQFVTNKGTSITIAVKFDGISAKDSGTVIEGIATGVHDPIVIQPENGMKYRVENIVFNSDLITSAIADVSIELPNGILISQQGLTSKIVLLPGAAISTDLGFVASKTLSNGVPLEFLQPTTNPLQTQWVEDMPWYLVMDELPLAFATENMTFTPSKLVAQSKTIGHYFERYRGVGIHGPVYRTGSNAINANDGFLQSSVFQSDDFVITPTGITSQLSSLTSTSYVASVPFGFKISAEDVSFEIQRNQIVSGSLDNGTVASHYVHSLGEPLEFQTVAGTFSSIIVSESGMLRGHIQVADEVNWSDNGFVIQQNAFDNWTLIIAEITSSNRPAVPPKPGFDFNKIDYPYDSAVTLWDPVSTNPWLVPGFNVIGAGHIRWSCLDLELLADADLYIRRSGVTHNFLAQIPPGGASGDIHGYETLISKANFGFLDSKIDYHDVGLSIYLPYPANFSFSGNVGSFDDNGCPNAITPAAGYLELIADHWNLELSATSANFVEEVLSIGGGASLPHLFNSAGEAVEFTSTTINWYSNGRAGNVDVNQIPQSNFEGLSLTFDSSHGVVLNNPFESPPFDPNLTIDAIPDCDPESDCPGVISYKGGLISPYFGPLVNNDGGQVVELVTYTDHQDTIDSCFGCAEYIATNGINAEQVWISEAGLELKYPLLISKNSGFGITLVGMDRLHVLPYEPAEWLEIIKLDTSAVIDTLISDETGLVESRTNLFLGMTSLPAVAKAVIDSQFEEIPETYDEETSNLLTVWLDGLISEDSGLSEDEVELYLGFEDIQNLNACKSILSSIWSDGDWDYTTSREQINASAEIEEGCFEVSFIESQVSDGVDNAVRLETLLNLGGGVGQALEFEDSDYETEFRYLRGDVVFSSNNGGPGEDFEEFNLNFRFKIADEEDVFINTPSLLIRYDKSGDFTIAGVNVSVDMFEYEVERADFTLTISTAQGNIGVNGGVTYYDGVEFEVVELGVVAGVFGIGQDVLYVGLMGDGELTGELGGQIGAGILIGRVNQSSALVLSNHGFADLVERVPLENAMTGIYLRGLGAVPIINDGCALSLDVGAELEVWYFTGEPEDVYGGTLRGFAYGEALCVISARGDVTLSIAKVVHAGEAATRFDGNAWVAGGIGFDCDPGTWGPTWDGRWWGDGWCWQAGAAVDVLWQSWDGWQYTMDADYE